MIGWMKSVKLGNLAGWWESRELGKLSLAKLTFLRISQNRKVNSLTVPVIYIKPPPKCGAKEFFKEVIECLKYRAVKGVISDFRDRVKEILTGCQVEMLIIDEADRLKPETFPEVRDIRDLGITVVLVGTDRLNTVIKHDEQVHDAFELVGGLVS